MPVEAAVPSAAVPSSVTSSWKKPGCSTHLSTTRSASACRSTLESASRVTASRQEQAFGGTRSQRTSSSTARGAAAVTSATTLRICTLRSTESSRSAWTLARTVSSASPSVVPTSAKSAATRGSPACTTRRASTCSVARVRRWPTLSWISRAMRARSARVASSTSYSWRSMRSRFLAASSSARPRRASLVWRFAAAERSVWVERTERRHARPMQSNVTGAVAGVAAAQAQARSAPAAAGSTRGQPRASRPPGSRGRARS